MSVEQDLKNRNLWANGFRTANGNAVRIYATDAGGHYPVHGAYLEDGHYNWTECTWTETGCWHSNSVVRGNNLVRKVDHRPLRGDELTSMIGNTIRRKGTPFQFLVVSAGPHGIAVCENDTIKRISSCVLKAEWEWPNGNPLSVECDPSDIPF